MVDNILKIDSKEIKIYNNILQLSDAPDIVTSGDGDKYIGYEQIGAAYSGSQKYVIEERSILTAEFIANVTGSGLFLDLACGDGFLTVPCAKLGTRIIAGDISNTMMTILQERAKQNGISIENVTLGRMNALDLPIKDESVDCVVANSVLHLISNPRKVLGEIYRVLKPGGSFVCMDDAPGKQPELGEEYKRENEEYLQLSNGIYRTYWAKLNAQGVSAKKYSWKFDRDSACRELFGTVTTKRIECGNPYFVRLVDSFLPRFLARGFSDQVDVSAELHKMICAEVISDFRNKYGNRFEQIGYHGIEEDIEITSYMKGK